MSEKLKRVLGKAQKALTRKEYEAASILFEEASLLAPETPEVWAGLGEVALGVGQADTAVSFLEQAAHLRPDNARYQRRLGEAYGRTGRTEEGMEALLRARRLAPKDVGILCALAGAYAKTGNWHQAKAVMLEVVQRPRPLAAYYDLLGMACQQLGELDEALDGFRKATALEPRYAPAWLSLGHLYKQKNMLDKAEACLKRLFALAPTEATTLSLAGEVAVARGNFQEAAGSFRAGLERAPGNAAMQVKLAMALVQCGDTLAAVEAMERAHAMGVAGDWILEQMGAMLTLQWQTDIARENLELAVARNPDNLNAWNILIILYTRLGESEKARQAAESILARNPDHVPALSNLATWYAGQARNEEAIALLKKALTLKPGSPILYTNMLWFLVHSSETSAADVLAAAQAFDRNLCRPLLRQDGFVGRDRNTERKLRIGWLSSDMNRHPVALFVLPFLRLLDRREVEVFMYYNSLRSDSLTEMAKAGVDTWREIFALGDEAVADLIRADQIDILVDLNGNTEGNRLLVVARKPAPIQVTWLGFPGTSGMTAMDYIFIPPDPVLEQGTWCSETAWPLPDCYGVRAELTSGIDVCPGLPCEQTGIFTFACLNTFRKVSRKAVEAWSRILERVPESRLMLVAHGGQEDTLAQYIKNLFANHGIAPERLDIHGFMPTKEYFLAYNKVDLCLDPFPFNGGTTGYDSIWMGVPFITWPGDMLVSRMGRAILENVGLHELVVDSAEAYVELAVQLAGDPESLKRLRSGLRERMQASPLLDAPRMARSLEQAFRAMWARWCGAEEAA